MYEYYCSDVQLRQGAHAAIWPYHIECVLDLCRPVTRMQIRQQRARAQSARVRQDPLGCVDAPQAHVSATLYSECSQSRRNGVRLWDVEIARPKLRRVKKENIKSY